MGFWESLDRVQRTAVRWKELLHHSCIEDLLDFLRMVHRVVVHVHQRFALDSLNELMHKLQEGAGVITPFEDLGIDKAISLTDGANDGEAGPSGGGHLKRHVVLDPSARWYHPLVESGLVHIDDLLVGNHRLCDLSAHQLLSLQEQLLLSNLS